MIIDLTTEFGARVARRLQSDEIVWLTTVRPNGTPEPSPVWFYWDGATFLVYSHPGKVKLQDIAANPRVALNFNSDETGDDIVVFTGDAREDRSVPPANKFKEYLAKYEKPIVRIGMTPESFARAYSVPIRVTPTKVRGFNRSHRKQYVQAVAVLNDVRLALRADQSEFFRLG
ncbi:MAG TPA: TIGR03667 family PPOX class F420-dependent oxidoreductase [Chloroflexota bacterium]|nr:TIGR03667 family PPOX class F420-dependent oxidoreductase [Chloroflexota bacterium]